MKTSFKTVPDTNILLASEKSANPNSPNKEFFNRWKNKEFDILFSDDTLAEYIEKMQEKRVPKEIIKQFIQAILELGYNVHIVFYHLPIYPTDADDIAFLLCAENGKATHLISYDNHLKEIDYAYSFRVCKTIEFLAELREALEKNG